MTKFERLIARAVPAAALRAQARADALAQRMQSELPPGIRAERIDEGVRLVGRDLRRRLALEPGLRWLTGRLR